MRATALASAIAAIAGASTPPPTGGPCQLCRHAKRSAVSGGACAVCIGKLDATPPHRRRRKALKILRKHAPGRKG